MKTIIDWILRISGLISLVWYFLSYFDLMPYYQIKLYQVNSLTPRINLFPSDRIRLDIDFHNPSDKDDIKSAVWKISKKDKRFLPIDGIYPTLRIPPDGGIYTFEVTITNTDNIHRHGVSNFYVVQDTPGTLKSGKEIPIPTSKNKSDISFLDVIRSSGAEIYTGTNNWRSIKVKKQTNNDSLKLQTEVDVPIYNNQILVRAKGDEKNILNYKYLPVPLNNKCDKEGQ